MRISDWSSDVCSSDLQRWHKHTSRSTDAKHEARHCCIPAHINNNNTMNQASACCTTVAIAGVRNKEKQECAGGERGKVGVGILSVVEQLLDSNIWRCKEQRCNLWTSFSQLMTPETFRSARLQKMYLVVLIVFAIKSHKLVN